MSTKRPVITVELERNCPECGQVFAWSTANPQKVYCGKKCKGSAYRKGLKVRETRSRMSAQPEKYRWLYWNGQQNKEGEILTPPAMSAKWAYETADCMLAERDKS
jgi:hypothetical protein